MTIAVYQPQEIMQTQEKQIWFPDFYAARAAVDDHIDTLGSTQETPEKHTKKQYGYIMDAWLQWLDGRMPDEKTVREYIAELSRQGRGVSTINRYIVVIKHFCRALSSQPIYPFTDENYTEGKRFALSEARQFCATVTDMKGLRKRRKTNQARLDQFAWRSKDEMLTILHHLNRTSWVRDKRDYAIFTLAFNSALRVAEIARITLNNFKRHSDNTVLIVNLRGKGLNYDPLPIPLYVYRIIQEYVNAYNANFPADDPHRIDNNTPIWRAFTKTGAYVTKHTKPLGRAAIANIIKRRSSEAGYPMNAHDTRRSAVAYLRSIGMDHHAIKNVTRHQSLDMVAKYAGTETKWDDFNHFVKSGIMLA